VQRWLFRRELESLAPASVYYLDECGVDHRRYREYGHASRGERIYETVAGRHRERTSVIAACQDDKLVAPLTFAGTCNTEVVDAYFEHVLLPVLPPGSVIVLDNARFHQSPTTAARVAAAGCALLFLPAYSPDLNPIEHLWAAVKTRRQPSPFCRLNLPMLLLIAIVRPSGNIVNKAGLLVILPQVLVMATE
jgi:transposase